ncbi:MAG: hypothetical protein N3I86_16645, partial [Verrucomicrobiae bacterium]|nr:hypothetical protein [Verrucomicrobiae bacterium]
EVRCQLYLAEDLGYLDAATALALRGECAEIGRQISAWIKSMQTLGFQSGPAYHKEPDTSIERFARRHGLERQPNGSYRSVREPPPVYGNGKRKTEMRKKGKG